VVEGTIYPLLTRLKNDGLLPLGESTSGPPRKYYGLTEIGLTFLNELNSTWTELSDAVNLITNQKTIAMNKTVNINLGGMFFLDEDAYLKLTRYFDAIKIAL
jgi:DNA-binding PadR family transcriptional regulator